jgi:hypothetical protein
LVEASDRRAVAARARRHSMLASGLLDGIEAAAL